MNPVIRLFGAALMCLLAAACTRGNEPAGPISPAAVKYVAGEHFMVGEDAYVRSLHIDRGPHGGQLYVGTSIGVLQVDLDTGNPVRTLTTKDGMRNSYAFVVRPGPSGTIWMGTNGGGLATLTRGKIDNWLPKHGLADLWIYDVAFHPDGSVWLATWDGVNRIQGGASGMADKAGWATYNVGDGLANPWVYAIQIDGGGALWFGTEGGLSRLADSKWTSWRHEDGLGAPNPAGLARSDKSGFGSVREGEHSHDLTTLDGTGNETYNANYVFSLKLDTDGQLWIGTWGGGVARFDGKKFVNYNSDNGLSGNVVYAIDQAPDGAMWFGTNHGVSRFDGETWTRIGKQEGLVGEDVYTLRADRDGTIWAGQKGAVTRLMREGTQPAP